MPYNGVNRGNGTYDVLDAYIRSNTGTAGTKAINWDSTSNLVTIQLPVPPVHPSVPAKPTLQTTSVQYHNDVTHEKIAGLIFLFLEKINHAIILYCREVLWAVAVYSSGGEVSMENHLKGITAHERLPSAYANVSFRNLCDCTVNVYFQ
nr:MULTISPECIES: hypothetical protein [Limosilactobacillus]